MEKYGDVTLKGVTIQTVDSDKNIVVNKGKMTIEDSNIIVGSSNSTSATTKIQNYGGEMNIIN